MDMKQAALLASKPLNYFTSGPQRLYSTRRGCRRWKSGPCGMVATLGQALGESAQLRFQY